MKKHQIKIRFVARCNNINDEPSDYLIQRKTLFGWKYITYTMRGGSGDVVNVLYCANTKKDLLNNVFKNYYRSCSEFYNIEEYPMIKTY